MIADDEKSRHLLGIITQTLNFRKPFVIDEFYRKTSCPDFRKPILETSELQKNDLREAPNGLRKRIGELRANLTNEKY